MARSKCSCGTQILWKADEADSKEWLLIARNRSPNPLISKPFWVEGRVLPYVPTAANCGSHGMRPTPAKEYVPAEPESAQP